jgi:hypothetical protein
MVDGCLTSVICRLKTLERNSDISMRLDNFHRGYGTSRGRKIYCLCRYSNRAPSRPWSSHCTYSANWPLVYAFLLVKSKVYLPINFKNISFFFFFFFFFFSLCIPSAYASGSTSASWLIVLSHMLDYTTLSTSYALSRPLSRESWRCKPLS